MHASGIKERLTNSLKKKTQIVLIGDKVERADTAGLQLLYAFKLEVASQNKKLSWQRPSDVLLTACANLGMTSALGILE
jgi:ABC-type transporter Mla MlaB component